MLKELRRRLPKGERLDVLYVGSQAGPEAAYAKKWHIPFKSIPVGKWRRYRDWRNLTDPFKVAAGTLKSLGIGARFRPDVIFSKGGFVSVPVLLAGAVLRRRIVIHDSDAKPGLTTRLCARFAEVVCLGWKEAAPYFPSRFQKKLRVTGVPVREEMLKGSKERARKRSGFKGKKPVVLIMGGSLGADKINQAVWKALPDLCKNFRVVHLTGPGKAKTVRGCEGGYVQIEVAHETLADFYALADVVVTRAGANTLAELEALNKPMILIPLGRESSHGDQLENARLLKARSANVRVIQNESLTARRLSEELVRWMKGKDRIGPRVGGKARVSAASAIADLLITP